MARIFITGSASGLGRATAAALLEEGQDVVVHVRNVGRLADVADLLDRGAVGVVGDLADEAETLDLARRVNRLGRLDAVIHNAGVYTGPDILAVNVLAPYLLTALIERPSRLVYLSSGMHRGGRVSVQGLEEGHPRHLPVSYSDSKLLVTTLAAAVARRWPAVLVNSVDPGWVPIRMGGPGATDDLALGHVTQAWLAVSSEPEALTSGGYWYHQRQQPAHPAVQDPGFQDELVTVLERLTGVGLP